MKDRALEAYFAEAASWDADRAAQGRRITRVAWWVAGAGWLCAIVSAGALMLLMPLKRVEPFVVRVDNGTGLVDVVPVYTGHADMPTCRRPSPVTSSTTMSRSASALISRPPRATTRNAVPTIPPPAIKIGTPCRREDRRSRAWIGSTSARIAGAAAGAAFAQVSTTFPHLGHVAPVGCN
jgi:VirB8 protein